LCDLIEDEVKYLTSAASPNISNDMQAVSF